MEGGDQKGGAEAAINEGAADSSTKTETSSAALAVADLAKSPANAIESAIDMKIAEIEKMIGWYEECPEPEQGWGNEYEAIRLFFRSADYPAHQAARKVTRLMPDNRIRVVSHLTQLRLFYKGKADQVVSNDFVGTMTGLGVDLSLFQK